MGVNVQQNFWHVERVSDVSSGETAAEGAVHVPERYPPIARVLQLLAEPQVASVNPTDDRVMVEGTVQLVLTYVAVDETANYYGDDEDDENGGMYRSAETVYRVALEGTPVFAYLLDLPGATEDSDVAVQLTTTGIEYDIGHDDRTLHVEVLLEVSAELKQRDVVRLTTAINGEHLEGSREDLRIKAWLGEVQGGTQAAGRLSLAGRSAPEHILSVAVVPTAVEMTQDGDEAVVHGYADCRMLYVGSEGAGAQAVSWPHAFSFEQRLPFAGDGGTVSWEPKVTVTDVRYSVVRDEGDVQLDCDVQLSIHAQAYRSEVVYSVTEVSSAEGEVATQTDTVTVYEAVAEGAARTEVSGVLSLSDDEPPLERLLTGDGQFSLHQVHVVDDKVVLEGEIAVDLLYVGRGDDEGTVHAARWPQAIVVDVDVPLPGAEPGMQHRVDVELRRLEFDMINWQTVEARVQVLATAEVGQLREVETVVDAVRLPPADEKQPTFTFVLTAEGDTLWKLAQMYRTTEEAIVATNAWLKEHDKLPMGRHICIVH